MTLLELVQRAIDIASLNKDTTVTRLAMEVAAEPLVLQAFRDVSANCARQEHKRTLLRRTKSLTLVNGAVALTDDVLTEYITDSNVIDPTDKTKRYSLTPWSQFITDELDLRLGHYAIEGETTLHVIEPGTPYDPAGGPTETLLLTTPCAVAVPTASGNAVVAPAEILDDLIAGLAAALAK